MAEAQIDNDQPENIDPKELHQTLLDTNPAFKHLRFDSFKTYYSNQRNILIKQHNKTSMNDAKYLPALVRGTTGAQKKVDILAD
jgi:hypothetical protein